MYGLVLHMNVFVEPMFVLHMNVFVEPMFDFNGLGVLVFASLGN